jgi:hypothetical protein
MTMAAAWRRSHGCGDKATLSSCTDEEAACSWPSTAWRRRRGCGGRPTDAEPRRPPPAPPSTWKSSGKLTGADRATRARSTEAELGGDVSDEGRCRRNPAVRRWSATGRGKSTRERRRISPELGEGRVGDASRQRQIGLGFVRE